MLLNMYGAMAVGTAIYPNRGSNLTYPILGLCGESGELAEKLKKCMRDDAGMLTPERRDAMIKELGDVLWYVAAVAAELGVTMEDVALGNLAKLASRKQSATLQGSGDDR